MANETTTPTLAPLDLTDLDTLLSDLAESAECKCESEHVSIQCSVTVVARKIVPCSHLSFLICQNSYNWNVGAMAEPDAVCDGCFRMINDCWKIIPV